MGVGVHLLCMDCRGNLASSSKQGELCIYPQMRGSGQVNPNTDENDRLPLLVFVV